MSWLLRVRRRGTVAGDEGVALLIVIAITLVASLFLTAMLVTVGNEQRGARQTRNVTTARQAAEAGIEATIFKLGQSTGLTSNYTTQCGTTAVTAVPTTNIGKGSYSGTVAGTPDGNCQLAFVGRYPAGTGNTRKITVIVNKASPAAFDYSMFASKGIDIHHHNSAYLSPQIITAKVHSNGYAKLDYSSEFTVEKFETVGPLSFQQGGGSTPGGAIPTSGYNWKDPLTNQCFPSGIVTGGACTAKYSGNATITGQIEAGSVLLGNRGNLLPGAATTTETGYAIPQTFGDIKTGSATLNGTVYSANGVYGAGGLSCGQCSKSTAAVGGQIGGNLTIQTGFAPPVLPFPNIDYSTTFRARALAEQAGAAPGASLTHVFTAGTAFVDYITGNVGTAATSDAVTKLFMNVNATTGALTPWTKTSATPPGAILLPGDYDITAGDLSLDWGSMLTKVTTTLTAVGATMKTPVQPPVILIQGSLVDEVGAMTLKAPMFVVGRGNRTDFLRNGTSIDVPTFLDPAATEPGLVAAGTGIDAQDYDSDSPWTAGLYEPNKISPIFIRGAVYSALWNATSKLSTPTNQHWHDYDPKNIIKLYGAQIGADLHNCNNFTFTYDPLVKRIYGFSDGTAAVVQLDYQDN